MVLKSKRQVSLGSRRMARNLAMNLPILIATLCARSRNGVHERLEAVWQETAGCVLAKLGVPDSPRWMAKAAFLCFPYTSGTSRRLLRRSRASAYSNQVYFPVLRQRCRRIAGVSVAEDLDPTHYNFIEMSPKRSPRESDIRRQTPSADAPASRDRAQSSCADCPCELGRSGYQKRALVPRWPSTVADA